MEKPTNIEELPRTSLLLMAEQKVSDIMSEVTRNPEFFLFNFVKTLDEHDRENPIKDFPQKDYFREIIKVFLDEKLILVPKSRKMMMTWLFVALFLWDTMYHPGIATFYVSKREEDSDFLVKRSYFIYERLPNYLKIPCRLKYCNLEFPSINSKIQGMSQEADALRTQTASNLFFDEFAFQPYGREALQAAKPTIQGKGRFVGVSTANGKNFFYNIMNDLE